MAKAALLARESVDRSLVCDGEVNAERNLKAFEQSSFKYP
jgi:hypothetical protein